MKKLLLIFVASFAVTLSFAGVPEKISNAFHVRYGGATHVRWKNNVINYTVSFHLKDATYHAVFDKKGEFLLSTRALRAEELPGAVKNGFKKTRYAGWKVSSSYVEYFPKDPPRYHLRTAKGRVQRKNLVFDAEGNVVQQK